MKKIYIGSDHAGYKLKQGVKAYLDNIGVEYEDLGNLKHNKQDDYPDYSALVAQAVAKDKTRGILICGSSIGVCITANKFKGVYAAPVTTEREAQISVTHNKANIICLSGWNLSLAKAKKIIRKWLSTKYKVVKRHERRVQKIKKIEEKHFKRGRWGYKIN